MIRPRSHSPKKQKRAPATLDSCSNCLYWGEEGINGRHVCNIISRPELYQNNIALVTARGVWVETAAAFHCTLFKIRSKEPRA